MELAKEALKNETIGPIAIIGLIILLFIVIYKIYKNKEIKKDL